MALTAVAAVGIAVTSIANIAAADIAAAEGFAVEDGKGLENKKWMKRRLGQDWREEVGEKMLSK